MPRQGRNAVPASNRAEPVRLGAAGDGIHVAFSSPARGERAAGRRTERSHGARRDVQRDTGEILTPYPLSAILDSRAFAIFARIVLTFVFWSAGLGMALDYGETLRTMSHFGLQPAHLWAPAVIATLLAGSALVIANRWAWLGFGILAAFTALSIPIAHAFWTMSGEERLAHFHFTVEHVSLIGGLMAGAIVNRALEKRAIERRDLEKRALARPTATLAR